jgi:hypothetical protein
VSKAGLCGTHEGILALDRLRKPERPRNGARPRGFVEVDTSANGRGANRRAHRLWS